MAVGGRGGGREEKRGHGRKRKEEGGRRVLKAGNGASKKKRGRRSSIPFCPLSLPPFLSPISYHVRTSRETQLSSLLLFFFFTEPFTKYKLWLKAFTWKNEGEPSEPFEIVTDVEGPSAPVITNLVKNHITKR